METPLFRFCLLLVSLSMVLAGSSAAIRHNNVGQAGKTVGEEATLTYWVVKCSVSPSCGE